MQLFLKFRDPYKTLFVDYLFGKEAGDEYNYGIRKGIHNDKPIIPDYNVNAQGSGDMYPKSGNMLQAIRHSLDNDEAFRQILRGLNKTFYHQTVTAAQIENYISTQAHYDYSKVFEQYLTTTQIPKLEFYFTDNNKTVFYRWTNCVKGFNLPLTLKNKEALIKIIPTEEWKRVNLKDKEVTLFDPASIEKMYYITPVLLQKDK